MRRLGSCLGEMFPLSGHIRRAVTSTLAANISLHGTASICWVFCHTCLPLSPLMPHNHLPWGFLPLLWQHTTSVRQILLESCSGPTQSSVADDSVSWMPHQLQLKQGVRSNLPAVLPKEARTTPERH